LPDQVRNEQQKALPWQMPQLRRHICVATFLPAIMQLLVQQPMDIHTVQVVRSRQLLFIAHPGKHGRKRDVAVAYLAAERRKQDHKVSKFASKKLWLSRLDIHVRC
jgi:hypothetical protein